MGPWEEFLERAAVDEPTLGDVPREEFVAYVTARLPVGPTEGGLPNLRAGDLFLAFLCAGGNKRALERFEARHGQNLRAAVKRIDTGNSFGDDALQNLRTRLLVGTETEPPRIMQYAGRGDLGSWVRVAAVRDVLMILRREKREARSEQERLLEVAAPVDEELEHIKKRYRGDFEAAFAESVNALSKRERNLLRHHYLDELTTEEIGRIYDVHRATATRWLGRIRLTLLTETKSRLAHRLDVDAGELESIMRLVQSRMQMSVRALLDSDEPNS